MLVCFVEGAVTGLSSAAVLATAVTAAAAVPTPDCEIIAARTVSRLQ
jgi:hypothetical protein